MLTIEEYIAKRKLEDRVNEFDVEKRADNTRACVNYVFEYFNNYLDITEADHHTALEQERIAHLRKRIGEYDSEVLDWLIEMYTDHGHYLHRLLKGILDEDQLFLLYHTNEEFRSVSYECYSRLAKKHSYLKNQTEMLFRFIKDHQHVLANKTNIREAPFINTAFAEWIETTKTKYGVFLPAFASFYVDWFYEHPETWPARHRYRTDQGLPGYDHRQKSNLFNLDSLFTKVSRKPFLRGHKQDLETLVMYYWLNDIWGDEEYWDEYLKKAYGTEKDS